MKRKLIYLSNYIIYSRDMQLQKHPSQLRQYKRSQEHYFFELLSKLTKDQRIRYGDRKPKNSLALIY